MVHDILYPNHTKDYRTTAAFPLDQLDGLALCFVRVDHSYRASLDVIQGTQFRGRPRDCIWLHIKDGHLTLLAPEDYLHYFPCARVVPAVGWRQLLAAAEDSPCVHKVQACRICSAEADNRHGRTGYEQGAIGSGYFRVGSALSSPPCTVWAGEPPRAAEAAHLSGHILLSGRADSALQLSASDNPNELLSHATVVHFAAAWRADPLYAAQLLEHLATQSWPLVYVELPPAAVVDGRDRDLAPFVAQALSKLNLCTRQLVVATPVEAAARQCSALHTALQDLTPHECKAASPLPAGVRGAVRSWIWRASCPRLAGALGVCRTSLAVAHCLLQHAQIAVAPDLSSAAGASDADLPGMPSNRSDGTGKISWGGLLLIIRSKNL
jgi:hypothetical protein